MDFKLTSSYQPSGDQPTAIQQLVEGLNRGDEAQTLLGVTGSGKTFTIANVLQRVNRPALVLLPTILSPRLKPMVAAISLTNLV